MRLLDEPIIAICIFAAAASCAQAATMTLAVDGKTDCMIVVGNSGIEPERTAAEELRAYLKTITGADFAILDESRAPANKPLILVGPSQRLKDLIPDFNWASLGSDGIIIKTVGNHLLLAGGRPRGTLYAVYTFLENAGGCRWWTSSENTIPHKPTLRIPALNVTHAPQLRYREVHYADVMRNPEFAVKLKLNGHFSNIAPRHGGHHVILGWCHTFFQFLPPQTHFAQHPDWYSVVKGKRVAENAQLCLTNEEMRKELTRVVRERLRANPDCDMISISQNDASISRNPGGGRCECSRCKALEEAEEAPSGPVIHFVNAVARDIAKERPDVGIETLAYAYTRRPPLHVRPEPNVVVRLCDIEATFARPLDSRNNSRFQDDIRKWSAIAPTLYIWDYVANYCNYMAPHPNLRVLGPNIRFFARNRAVGIFEEGDAECPIGDFVRLRAWVLAHLLWNPQENDQRLIQEFLKGYYGKAAPYLSDYLDLVHDAFEDTHLPLKCFNEDLSFLTLDQMNEATCLFSKAEQAVAGDSALSFRVQRERFSLDHLWVLRYQELRQMAIAQKQPFFGPDDPVAATRKLIQTARSFNVVGYRSNGSFASYEPVLWSLIPH